MLSSVLRSKRAIEVNIVIMRVFVKLREMLTTHKELAQKLADLERRFEDHDEQFNIVFDAIRALMAPPEKPRKKIGFEVKEPRAIYGKRTKGSRKKKRPISGTSARRCYRWGGYILVNSIKTWFKSQIVFGSRVESFSFQQHSL